MGNTCTESERQGWPCCCQPLYRRRPLQRVSRTSVFLDPPAQPISLLSSFLAGQDGSLVSFSESRDVPPICLSLSAFLAVRELVVWFVPLSSSFSSFLSASHRLLFILFLLFIPVLLRERDSERVTGTSTGVRVCTCMDELSLRLSSLRHRVKELSADLETTGLVAPEESRRSSSTTSWLLAVEAKEGFPCKCGDVHAWLEWLSL